MKLYTPKEAASILAVEPSTVLRLIRRGRIQATKQSGQYFITAEAIADYQQVERIGGRPPGFRAPRQ